MNLNIQVISIRTLIYGAVTISSILWGNSAFAQAPVASSFEYLGCDRAEGWVCVPPASTIRIYDGTNASGTLLVSGATDVERTDIAGAGVCTGQPGETILGFSIPLPASINDGLVRPIHAYAEVGGVEYALTHSPRSLSCMAGTPDLSVSTLSTQLTATGTMTFTGQVQNQGTAVTPSPWDTEISIDYQCDGSVDTTLPFVDTTSMLGVGTSRVFTVSVGMTRTGNHCYRFVVNPLQASFTELLYANNVTPWTPFTYTDTGIVVNDPTKPPVITYFGGRAVGGQWEEASVHLPFTTTDVEISWSAENADTCYTADSHPSLVPTPWNPNKNWLDTGGAVVGIASTPEATLPPPNSGRNIILVCDGPGGSVAKSMYWSRLDAQAPSLTVGLSVNGAAPSDTVTIDSDDTYDLSWNSDINEANGDFCTSHSGVRTYSTDNRVRNNKYIPPSTRPAADFFDNTNNRKMGLARARSIGPGDTYDYAKLSTFLAPGPSDTSWSFAITCYRYTGGTPGNYYYRHTVKSIHFNIVPADAPAPTVRLQHKLAHESVWSTADSRTIEVGDNLHLQWITENAVSCTGTNFTTSGRVNGIDPDVIEPTMGNTSTYELSCDGPGGTVERTVTVTSAGSVIVGGEMCLDSGSPRPVELWEMVGPGGVCMNAVDLQAGAPSISLASATTDPATGQYNSVNVLSLIQNHGPGAVPNGESLSYVSYIQVAGQPDIVSPTNYHTSGITAPATGSYTESPTLSHTFNNLPFGTHQFCSRVNLDGSPNFPERVADIANNTACTTFTLPVPTPPMTLTSDRVLIRSGQSVTLSWNVPVTYPLSCAVSGPGMTTQTFTTPGSTSGSLNTNARVASNRFALTCTEPVTGTSFPPATIAVDVVPEFEEI